MASFGQKIIKPAIHKICVEFYVVDGSGEEIAQRMGIAKRTLYDRIHLLHQKVLGLLNDVVAGC